MRSDTPFRLEPDPPPSADADRCRQRRLDLNRRLRAAFLAGAEERSQRAHGRGLTEEELRGVLREYRGDLPGTLPDVPARGPAYRTPEPVTLTSGFRDRLVILVPQATMPDWRLFTAAADGAVRSLDQRYGSLLELASTVEEQARKWSLVARMRLVDGPDGMIEFEVA